MTTAFDSPQSELAKALAEFQAEMPTVTKSHTANVRMKDGGTYSYAYASLADVTEAAAPVLSSHGLAFTCASQPAGDGTFVLVGRLMHTSGQFVEGVLPLYGRTPQEIGGSITYMRRYLLGSLSGLVTDDDPDAPGAAKRTRRQVPDGQALTRKTQGQMFALFKRKGISESAQLAGIINLIGREVESRTDITEAEAKTVIERLNSRPDAPSAGRPARARSSSQADGESGSSEPTASDAAGSELSDQEIEESSDATAAP